MPDSPDTVDASIIRSLEQDFISTLNYTLNGDESPGGAPADDCDVSDLHSDRERASSGDMSSDERRMIDSLPPLPTSKPPLDRENLTEKSWCTSTDEDMPADEAPPLAYFTTTTSTTTTVHPEFNGRLSPSTDSVTPSRPPRRKKHKPPPLDFSRRIGDKDNPFKELENDNILPSLSREDELRDDKDLKVPEATDKNPTREESASLGDNDATTEDNAENPFSSVTEPTIGTAVVETCVVPKMLQSTCPIIIEDIGETDSDSDEDSDSLSDDYTVLPSGGNTGQQSIPASDSECKIRTGQKSEISEASIFVSKAEMVGGNSEGLQPVVINVEVARPTVHTETPSNKQVLIPSDQESITGSQDSVTASFSVESRHVEMSARSTSRSYVSATINLAAAPSVNGFSEDSNSQTVETKPSLIIEEVRADTPESVADSKQVENVEIIDEEEEPHSETEEIEEEIIPEEEDEEHEEEEGEPEEEKDVSETFPKIYSIKFSHLQLTSQSNT